MFKFWCVLSSIGSLSIVSVCVFCGIGFFGMVVLKWFESVSSLVVVMMRNVVVMFEWLFMRRCV